MKKRIKLLCILFFIGIGVSFAQNRISGTVTDENGEPIIGASVLVKGTSVGTSTNIEGKFTLDVPASSRTLVISYVGMKTLEVPVQASVSARLQTDERVLSDVVVVGYGTQRKENLTGAVSSVDVSKTLESRPIADVGRGLQGSTPGLTVIVPSGEVGSDPLMKIRGQLASFEGGTKPLILLDNVEIPSMQVVNPNDIESHLILKDAASASIYGAKGAFGVILITTKKGVGKDKINVQYSANTSWQNISKRIEMGQLDALEYSVLAFERVGGTVAGAFWQVTRPSYEKAKIWANTYGKMSIDEPLIYGRDW